MSVKLSEYLSEHPFHDYVFMYNNAVYQSYNQSLADLYVLSVKRDNYGCRYIITVSDVVYYNETVTPMQIKLPTNKNIIDAKNEALRFLKSINGITINENNIISVHYHNKTYQYKLHTKKLMTNLCGGTAYLPYIRRI